MGFHAMRRRRSEGSRVAFVRHLQASPGFTTAGDAVLGCSVESTPIKPAHGGVRRFVESPYALQIFCVAAFSVRLRLRIYAGWPNNADRLRDVVGTKPSGKNNKGPDLFDDPATDAPVVRHAERTNLPVRRAVAVQQEIFGNTLVAPRDLDALFPVNGHAAHDHAARQCRPDGRDVSRTEQFRRRAKMDDRWLQSPRPLDDQSCSRRKEKRRKLRWRRNCSGNLSRPSERLFARKLTIAYQDADVVNSDF
jgi:hypothetical protein